MIKKTWVVGTILLSFFSFFTSAQTLKTGVWRFELTADRASIPFLIEFEWQKNKLAGKLYNGKETIPLTDVVYTRKSLRIPLQNYEIVLELQEQSPELLTGYLIKQNKSPQLKYPIKGVQGINERFPEEKSPAKIDLNGRWELKLTDSDNVTTPGIGLFQQKGNYVTGTIMTMTGDYRYLEGFVSGNEFKLASFDGVFNFLLKGKVEEGNLKAVLAANLVTNIEGKKNSQAELPSAYEQTKVSELSFKFPDLSGKIISLADPKFKNKPVIVQFFGSWCPNCIDEMNYFIPWYKENQKRGVEIIALAFERSLTEMDAKRQLLKVQKKKNVPYTLLIAGSTSKDKPMDKIPGLKNFISFPTTVFLNKKHEVVKVHAGFNGPSTGEFFEKWKTEFNQTINELLK
ncbi:MAG: peroxiredoxin family protein [Bacteriovoracaceae bacterium]